MKKIKIKNFKSIKDEEVEFKQGLNIFVGENNSGKSNLIEAINFVLGGTKKEEEVVKNKNPQKDDKSFVEVVFSGDIRSLIDKFAPSVKKEDLKKFVYEKDGKQLFRVKRDTKDKKIQLFSYGDNKYKKASITDSQFKRLFDFETIWADSDPDENTKYSSTTILKKLMDLILESFEEHDMYKEYQKKFQEVFNSTSSKLRLKIDEIQNKSDEILKEQFSKVNIKLEFEEFNRETFLKNTKIKVKDEHLEDLIDFEEKGEGTQRAIIISLIQVYANCIKESDNQDTTKPFFLFLDEPELSLHPEAQRKLLKNLLVLSEIDQVFISTHSIYFLEPPIFKNVFRFKNSKGEGTKIFYDEEEKMKEIKENRNFFFHHRDVLFKNKVLFVEGVEDLERYTKFFEREDDLKWFISNIFMVSGKAGFNQDFKNLFEVFKIDHLCIKDLDHLYRRIKSSVDGLTEKTQGQKEWLRENYPKIHQSGLADRTEIKKNHQNEKVLVNPFTDIKDFLDESGCIMNKEDTWDFVKKLREWVNPIPTIENEN